MRSKINYEWCIENFTNDEYKDIIENNFSDKLSFDKSDFDAEEGHATRLVLVRNEGNEMEGVTDRHWAYVKDGKLPLVFENGQSEPTGILVPQIFHKQIASYFQNL